MNTEKAHEEIKSDAQKFYDQVRSTAAINNIDPDEFAKEIYEDFLNGCFGLESAKIDPLRDFAKGMNSLYGGVKS